MTIVTIKQHVCDDHIIVYDNILIYDFMRTGFHYRPYVIIAT